MLQDGAPARHDIGSLVQRCLAWVQADHGTAWRPDEVHRRKIAVVEGAIKGTVGRQDGVAFFFVELRQQRRQAGRTAGHSTLETPWLRGLELADTEEPSKCRERPEDSHVYPQAGISAFSSAARGRGAAARGA